MLYSNKLKTATTNRFNMKTSTKLLRIIGYFAITCSCFANNNLPNEGSKSIDLVIKINDFAIGGTLVIPTNFKTPSLVIMSSGSGPKDRDETLEDFKIFKVIAEHWASQGIPSFRYDDRGIGESTGCFVNSTFQDHSNDLDYILEFFKSPNDHSFNNFILFGHSQGGILAAKVAIGNESVKSNSNGYTSGTISRSCSTSSQTRTV